jgi:hypothetical protein
MHAGGVLTKKRSMIGINEKYYCASDLAQNRRINICIITMEEDNQENI